MTAPAPSRLRSLLLIALLGWMLFGPRTAEAHRLDECLQAARITVGEDRVDIELDLTPGVALAERFLALIDLDRDGRISASEAEAYADLASTGLMLKVDEQRRRLQVEVDAFPEPDEIKAGVGVIRLKLRAVLPVFRAGRHRLSFQNRHYADQSVYLANALMPDSKRIEVVRQDRDPTQRDYRLEFAVK